jgi:hypothetical protein
MALYQYEKGIADLNAGRAQDQATQDYARFIGQQRFARQKDLQSQGFERGFPQFTGHYASQLGSGVRSGVMTDKLSQRVGDYNTQQAQLGADQAAFETNWGQTQTNQEAAYQTALENLRRQLAEQRLGVDPFASYMGA